MGFFIKEVEPKEQLSKETLALLEPPVGMTKQEAKNKAKADIGKKFVIGQVYMLRQKSVYGSKEIVKKYVLKKFIYT